MEYAYNIVAKKPEGKILFERHRHRWEDNNKMGLKEIECENMDYGLDSSSSALRPVAGSCKTW
jgi:hypothetical protein